MALAILELLDPGKEDVRFKIDTGTNTYYRLKIGRNVRRRSGIDWVDDVYISTPMAANKRGGDLFNSSMLISIPAARFEKEKAYVQLFSFKDLQCKSPAFSRVVVMSSVFDVPLGAPMGFSRSCSAGAAMNTSHVFQTPRRVPCRSSAEVYARQSSLEDLLAGIVKVAAPEVLKLLSGGQNAPSGSTGSKESSGQADILVQLLSAILGGIGGKAPVSGKSLSLIQPESPGNRFIEKENDRFARPFFWQALLGAAIGPLIQTLPQLLNSANQQRVQLKQADNKLITDILSDVNRRMLLQQLLQAKNEAPSGGQQGDSAGMNQLIQLLQNASADAAAKGAPLPPVAAVPAAKSVSLHGGYSSALSSKALLSFETAEPVTWNGTQKLLFTKNSGMKLRVRFNVSAPAPTKTLPKAIVKVIFKDGSDQTVLSEKTFRQKGIQPNGVVDLAFTREEIANLPVNKPVSTFAEMRWLNMTGKEYKALGSSEIVFVNKLFLKEQGSGVSEEQELTDMKRFRPFWNKVWESPSLDAAGNGGRGDKKYLWELDVNAKYSVLLSAEHESNGLMETKILHGETDEESITRETKGRMKAGVELSVTELNRLLPLWSGETVLDREKLEAFNTEAFARNNAGEFIYNFKLKGRARERGVIWVVPVFKLLEFTLNTIQRTDDAGQVVAVAEEKVRFPLPVAARVIGLKSGG